MCRQRVDGWGTYSLCPYKSSTFSTHMNIMEEELQIELGRNALKTVSSPFIFAIFKLRGPLEVKKMSFRKSFLLN